MRKRKPSSAATMAKPLVGLLLLGLLWLAYKVGLLAMLANALIAPLAPHGQQNAGVIYKQLEAERLAKPKPVKTPE